MIALLLARTTPPSLETAFILCAFACVIGGGLSVGPTLDSGAPKHVIWIVPLVVVALIIGITVTWYHLAWEEYRRDTTQQEVPQ